MVRGDISRSQNGKQHESGAGAANKATAHHGEGSAGAEQVKKQFSNHSELEGSFKNQADAESKPPRLSTDRRGNIHSVKGELLNGFEDYVSKENWEQPVKSAPPEENGERYL
jgi:hypothetical protein